VPPIGPAPGAGRLISLPQAALHRHSSAADCGIIAAMTAPNSGLRILAITAVPALTDALRRAGLQVDEAGVAAAATAAARGQDALLFSAADHAALAALRELPLLPQAAFDQAVVVASAVTDEALEADLLRLGVEAVVIDPDPAALARALRHAVERKRVERATRTAYATDLATGLPHQQQLLEHMTQLIALREREPAAMVLLVLRVQGFAQTAARLGGEAANILRRKVAVRLRGNLRASDVVASMGPDAFGVLLGHLEAAADGERVAAKLVRSLQQPLQVAGQPCVVGAAVGMALYPDHGKDAAALLQRAAAQAGSLATGGEAPVTRLPRAGAANDEA
jgi:diguanylate cyclase (GGDEF)-like protein